MRSTVNHPKGVQVYEEPSPQQPSHDAVGRNLAHRTAAQQATGEAQYCDDIPLRSGEHKDDDEKKQN